MLAAARPGGQLGSSQLALQATCPAADRTPIQWVLLCASSARCQVGWGPPLQMVHLLDEQSARQEGMEGTGMGSRWGRGGMVPAHTLVHTVEKERKITDG